MDACILYSDESLYFEGTTCIFVTPSMSDMLQLEGRKWK